MTLKYPNANSYAFQAIMLATAGVKVCLLEPPGSQIISLERSERQVVVPDQDFFDQCVETLGQDDSVRVKSGFCWQPERPKSFFVYKSKADNLKSKNIEDLSASKYAHSTHRIYHLNLLNIDTSIATFLSSQNTPHIRSLDLSRLELTDQVIFELVTSGRLKNLRSLDLSGNREITRMSVEAICESIRNREIPWLEQLELLGTDCDASPYIDGHYWRISETARELAKSFGFQAWMMLGSKSPDMANREILTREERNLYSAEIT